MKIKKIAWRFFVVCFGITVVSLWITTWYSTHIHKRLFIEKTIEDVDTRARLLQRELSRFITDSTNYTQLDSLCVKIGDEINTRITIILPTGEVIADSERDPRSMDDHGDRPEIVEVFSGHKGVETRYSNTLNKEMVYLALPMEKMGEITAVLRLAVAIDMIKEHNRNFYQKLLFISLTTLVLLAAASVLIAQWLTKPIKEINLGAQRFSRGELGTRLAIPSAEELGELAKTLNSMAETLNDRIHTITHQKNELNAILTSMNEGVIAVDQNERVISINPAAARLLNVGEKEVNGRWLHDIVRNSALQAFVKETLSSSGKTETDFVFSSPDGDLFIQAYGTGLDKDKGKEKGAVLVLNDITKIRRLESIRRDFVANVSHELRTPLTSIKGFIETIRAGSYKLPQEVSQFLQIISSKTERLCSIVDDILSLSSIERDHEHRDITFEPSELAPVLEEAIKTCRYKAKAKRIELNLSCGPDCTAYVNAPMIEQAVINLIDNAVKYSEEGKTITVSASLGENSTVIKVTDQGIGIPLEHLDRIFERFYRIDKARSRKIGGTGLGLSIVKNIVNAHGGRVTVESKPEEGSTFSIHIPTAGTNEGMHNARA
ncbi:MAG: ATP-binding protein [Chitinispirillaceae bacterium]